MDQPDYVDPTDGALASTDLGPRPNLGTSKGYRPVSLRKRLISSLAESRLLNLADRVFGCGGILYLHDVTPEPFLSNAHVTGATFARLIEALASRYELIPLHQFVSRRVGGRSLRGCVAISFDDAYHGVLRYALPVLERFRVPATVFVATDFHEHPGAFWWDRIEWVRRHAPPEAATRLFQELLGRPSGTFLQVHESITGPFQGRFPARAEAILAEIEPLLPPMPVRPLSAGELMELARSALIDFGCHTRSHPTLPALPFDRQVQEIRESHEWLATRLANVRPFIAYPYGLYDRQSMKAARVAGMTAGFTIQGHAPVPWGGPFAYPRIGVTEDNAKTVGLRLSWLAIPALVVKNGGWHPGRARSGV